MDNQAGTQKCEQCGSEFTCDIKVGKKKCWCMELPFLVHLTSNSYSKEKSCLCPTCLKTLIAQKEQKAS